MITVHRLNDPTDSRLVQVREFFQAYQAELGVDLCFQGFQDELASLPGPYQEPLGRLFLYSLQGDFVGVGALKPLADGSVELKRIYLIPKARGAGLGKQITLQLLNEARSIGYTTAKLDTLARLAIAVSMYRSLGFVETTPYNHNPEPDILYFELTL